MNNASRVGDLRHRDGCLGANFTDQELDAVLVDQLVSSVHSRVGFALTVFDDQLDLATVNATLGIPFLDSQFNRL